MNTFNHHTALNLRLQQDEAETLLNRIEAKRRQSVRHINKAFRQSVITVAIDAALVGAIIASFVILLACSVG